MKRKYISLKDAAIISGYTVPELKNFIKIGLISCRKRKNRMFVPFSAFEKMNETDKVKKMETVKSPGKSPITRALGSKTITSLVPFGNAHPHLVKVLETTAFSAAIVMALHIGLMPHVAEKVIFGFEVTHSTVSFMGDRVEELVEESVSLPAAFAINLISMPTYAQAETTAYEGQVAGAHYSSSSDENALSNSSLIEDMLIGIADASDSFERMVDKLGQETDRLLFQSLNFENLDPAIQSFFRL